MIRPKTNMVTEAPQTAVLRPNLSETRPAEKEPRAKPKIKVKINEISKDVKGTGKRVFTSTTTKF